MQIKCIKNNTAWNPCRYAVVCAPWRTPDKVRRCKFQWLVLKFLQTAFPHFVFYLIGYAIRFGCIKHHVSFSVAHFTEIPQLRIGMVSSKKHCSAAVNGPDAGLYTSTGGIRKPSMDVCAKILTDNGRRSFRGIEDPAFTIVPFLLAHCRTCICWLHNHGCG